MIRRNLLQAEPSGIWGDFEYMYIVNTKENLKMDWSFISSCFGQVSTSEHFVWNNLKMQHCEKQYCFSTANLFSKNKPLFYIKQVMAYCQYYMWHKWMPRRITELTRLFFFLLLALLLLYAILTAITDGTWKIYILFLQLAARLPACSSSCDMSSTIRVTKASVSSEDLFTVTRLWQY